MVVKLLFSFLLMATCVAVHASGVMAALRRIETSRRLADPSFWPMTLLLIRLAAWLILLHLAEIGLWAAFYVWQGALPDPHAAFYFSSVTYTTTGYGDLVLPEQWRLLGGVEALTGILMCGWSTGFFFAVMSRIHQARRGPGGG